MLLQKASHAAHRIGAKRRKMRKRVISPMFSPRLWAVPLATADNGHEHPPATGDFSLLVFESKIVFLRLFPSLKCARLMLVRPIAILLLSWNGITVEFPPVRSAPNGILILFLLSLSASSQVLPRPQITTAAGKQAPNFTLKDQSGKDFRLSSLRGQRVLLMFYRGYW